MTNISKIERYEFAQPVSPLTPQEIVPNNLLRRLAWLDADAMTEVEGSQQLAEMAGELLAYRLADQLPSSTPL